MWKRKKVNITDRLIHEQRREEGIPAKPVSSLDSYDISVFMTQNQDETLKNHLSINISFLIIV